MPDPAAHAVRTSASASPVDARGLSLLPVAVAVIGFCYRFLVHAGMSNDHFVHLARAQALLLGDLPIRDYTEEGVPLTVALSALAERLLGPTPFAELTLASSSFAVAAGVTCWLTTRLTGSAAWGLFAGLLQVMAHPRMYSHPKILIYPVVLAIGWLYLRHRTRAALVMLSACTALAFLIRHDHGLYAGIGGLAAVLLAHARDGVTSIARRAMAYAGVVLLLVSPYLAYVEYHLGLVDYFRLGAQISRTEARSGSWSWPVLRIAPGPLLVVRPRTREELARIHVRWRGDVDDDVRRQHERALGLAYAEPDQAERTWRYWIEPEGRDRLARLAALEQVEDTYGFDRRTFELQGGPEGLHAWLVRSGLTRVRPGPPIASVVSRENAAVALFYVVRLLPLAVFVVWWQRRRAGRGDADSAAVPLACVVTAVCAIGLMREAVGHRVLDVYGTVPILVAWLGAVALSHRPSLGSARLAVAAGLAFVVLATGRVTATDEHIRNTQVLEGPAAVLRRAGTVAATTRQWPWPLQWPANEDWRVARYVHDCTAPGDRLLVTWEAPEYYVFSRRAFAGGETLLWPPFRPPHTYEAGVVERLKTQSVPIVLHEAGRLAEFAEMYPRLIAYLEARYRRAGDRDFGPGHHVLVYVERGREVRGRDREFGWPCFVS